MNKREGDRFKIYKSVPLKHTILYCKIVSLGNADREYNMKTVSIPYPEGLPQTLKLSDSEFAEEVRFLASAKLFELGKISSGKAAKMAGLDRVSFLEKLGLYKMPAINIQAEEAEKEVEAIRSLE
jgi:predicted HTH domain antitoxin